MKVRNMESAKGNKIANQFIITDRKFIGHDMKEVFTETFQSYDSVIAVRYSGQFRNITIELDKKYWDYSVTTGKYRNIFLGETKKETQAKIDSGEYKLVNLN